MKLISKILMVLFLFSQISYAENISVKAIDTIAGYATVFTSSKIEPLQDINFQVIKPDGSTINLSSRSGTDGYAVSELDGYHTKKAGLYQVSASNKYEDLGKITRFQVFADIFSPIKSQISLDKPSLSAKTENLTVQVHLKDKYGNPIAGHLVKLISSRIEDAISPQDNGVSNEKGIAVFNVNSDFEGVSIFTALDQNLNAEINARQKVIFYAPEEKFSMGGEYFSADLISNNKADITAISEDFGVLDHFEVEFPDRVEVGSDQNRLTITAKDKDNNTVKSYEGKIIIEVDDANATIPNEGEYTFTPKDQGSIKFALAMVFTETGDKTINVYDYENNQINRNLKGTKKVIVAEKLIEHIDPIFEIGNLEIKSPEDGTDLKNKDVAVSGMAEANTNLKLMLDETKVAEISVDAEGFFSHFLKNLDDGKHSIYVIELEGDRLSSKPVSFSIDATAPTIDSLELFPTEAIYPENSYTLTIYSEPKLDYVKIRVAGTEEKLVESEIAEGKYEGSFFAPQNPGDYSIDVVMADKMGNEATYSKQAELKVIEKIIIPPLAPTNVLATAGDAKIDLTWNKSEFKEKTEKTIDHYNIYLGENSYDLKIIAQSKTQSALINDLDNDKEYIIAVSAVDNEELESEKSNTIKATPQKTLKNCTGNTYSSNGTEPCEICNSPNQVNNDNTECVEDKPNDPIKLEELHPVSEPLRAIPGDSKVTLSWDPYAEASKYKILLGVKSKKYEVEIITDDNRTSEVVKDLINELPYYFTLRALDDMDREIKDYPEIKAIPSGKGFLVVEPKKEIPPDLRDFSSDPRVAGQPGPETTIFIVVSFFIAMIVFLFKKTKVVKIANRSIKRDRRLQF